ncbi:MAG: prenyltransferase/squalene oxidase repeat-containing protein [Caldilineales bacterium]
MTFGNRSAQRKTLAALLITAALLFILAFAAAPQAAQGAATAPQTPPNAADVVVDLGDGHSIARRITFTQTQISGLQALQLTGLQLVTADYSFGTAVCAIEGTGCPASNCFCNANRFWGYSFWDGTVWQGHPAGAATILITNGAVEGWRWGGSNSTPPPVTRAWLGANAALQWMRPQQAANGSFGSNTGATLDVALAVAAANQSPAAWNGNSGASLLDYLRANAATFAGQSAAAAGKLAVGVAAADLDPRNFGAVDLAARLNAFYNAATGAFGATTQDQAWAMLGLQAAGEPVPAAAAQRLAAQANSDGGWGWTAGIVSDVDSSALAIQALRAAGQSPNAPAITHGLAWLRTVQLTNDDGGFASSPQQSWAVDSNTNSTAFAMQGILAAAQDPISSTWTVNSSTPLAFLLSRQLPNGAFVYTDPPANLFATQQAVPALVGKPYPLLSRAVALRRGLAWMATQQQADGSFAGYNPGATVDAVLAIAAAGRDPRSFSVGAQTPLTYLAAQAPTYAAQSSAAAGKLALGVAAARLDPRSFGGIDLVAVLQAAYTPASGQYGTGSVWDQALAMLGLRAAHQPVPAAAVTRLQQIAATGGGWGYSANAAAADVDSTALALQALAATAVAQDNAAVQGGLTFLRTAQNGDGGFPGYGGATDSASTGLALQGLAAYSNNPRALGWSTAITDGSASALTLHTPVDALLDLQSSAGGFPGYSGPNDPFSSYQALAGLSGKALPLRAPAPLFLPIIQKK